MHRPIPVNLVFVLITALSMTACSRQAIYETAIGLERSSAGLEPATVEVGNLDIAYLRNQQAVDGDTIVMVHGFGANKDNWTRMAGYLTDDFNVYAIDLPGHGGSSKPLDIGYRLEDQAGYLARILEALSIGEAHIMGNSMGGAISALYAANHADRVKSLVLFDPAGILEYPSPLVDLVSDGNNPLIPKQPGDFERLMDFALEEEPFVPWPILSVMEDRAIANQKVNEVIFAAIRDAGFEADFRNAIARIKAPVLIIWGRQDRVINYRNGEVFAQAIPDARLEVMEGIGHGPMIEAPEASAELFLEFIGQER